MYVEIKKFNKALSECHTHFEKWLYVLKNLAKLDNVPAQLQEKTFKKLFHVAEIAQFDPKQLQSYRDSEKNYLDFTASLHTSYKDGVVDGEKIGIEKGKVEGRIEGIIEGKIEIARKLKADGFSNAQIAKITGFTEQEIREL